MAKNILLTGATGFIGSHLLQEMVQKNYHVVAITRPNSNLWRIEHLQDKFTRCVITEPTMNMDAIFSEHKIDTIIHTATVYGRSNELSAVLMGNLIFPISLIESGLRYGLKRFINTDTFLCKGLYDGTYLKDYANSKTALQNFLFGFESQIQIDSLRLEHPFGENDSEGKFTNMLIESLLQKKEEIALTSGTQKRDFVYVQDVVNAFLTVLENDTVNAAYTEYEVGTGNSIPVRELVERVAAVIKSNTKLDFGALPSRVNEIADSKANIDKLQALGWSPQFDIERAVERIISIKKNK
jgi:nucleoside-diphosphate-sugar epimerase